MCGFACGWCSSVCCVFFFNDSATTEICTLSLHDALPIYLTEDDFDFLTSNKVWIATDRSRARRCVEAIQTLRSEERFSRNAETDLVCRLLLEKKKTTWTQTRNCERPTSSSSHTLPTLGDR